MNVEGRAGPGIMLKWRLGTGWLASGGGGLKIFKCLMILWMFRLA